MTPSRRATAASDGQLPAELRGRDLSGIPIESFLALSRLLDEVGGDVWVCGPTSLALQRVDGFTLRPPFHLLVLRGRNLHRAGHVVHTTTDLPLLDRATAHGLPVTSATRALIEVSGSVTSERLTIALDGAIRDGLTTDDFLLRRIARLRTKGRHGVPLLLRVIEGQEAIRGGQSWLEREFLRLVAAAGLPRPDTQRVLARRRPHTLVRVDFHFPGTPVVAETLGYRFHRTPGASSVDAARVNRLQLQGFLVLQFTYLLVVDAPQDVVADVRDALGRADVDRAG